MRISSFFYTVKQGFKNIWNNRLFSLASIATMAACIFMFGIFYSLAANFQAMVKSAEEGVAVTAFFDEGITEEQIQAIGDKIEKRAEVASYNYVSAEQAWEDFKKVYFQGAEDLADGFAEDNPLANSAHYEIYLNDVSMQDALVTYFAVIRRHPQGQPVGSRGKYAVRFQFAGQLHIDRDHHDLTCGFHIPNQQYRNDRYFGSERGDRYHETDRSDGLFCPGTVCGGRSSDRADRIRASARTALCALQ